LDLLKLSKGCYKKRLDIQNLAAAARFVLANEFRSKYKSRE